jgi:hypothetical protein
MRLVAEFTVDPDDGQPCRVEARGVDHYSIALKVIDAPSSTKQVRYRLHDADSKPVREVTRRMPDFEEPVTSHSNFEVVAEVVDGRTMKTLRKQLAEALEEGHKQNLTEPIQRAIAAIRGE